MKQIWTETYNGHESSYLGCRIERTTLSSGGHFYYMFWSQHVDWAAPHSRMSTNHRSLAAVKRQIETMLALENMDKTVIVRRTNALEEKQLWDARGYNSPISAANRKEA